MLGKGKTVAPFSLVVAPASGGPCNRVSPLVKKLTTPYIEVRGVLAVSTYEDLCMSQSSKFFDDLGRLMSDAAGVADGVRREAETAVRAQAQRFIADMDLVRREDFDALRELVQLQSEEIAQLRKELAAFRAKKKVE
jgi:BMFP domain-containing protein YqiC